MSTATKKVVGRPWPKGVSGNPAGRSKKSRQEMAKAKSHLDRLFRATKEGDHDKLAAIIYRGAVEGDGTCIRLACEYRWGKPVSEVEISGHDGGPLELRALSNAELLDRARVSIARIEEGERVLELTDGKD